MDEILNFIESVSEEFSSYSYCACLSWPFVKFCVCPPFSFGIEGRTVVIVLIPDHFLPIYFPAYKGLGSIRG